MKTDAPKTVHLKDYRKFGWQIEAVDLDFHLFESHTIVRARTRFRRDGGTGPIFLHGEGLELESVALDGRILSEGTDFTLTETGLTLPDPAREEFTIEVQTRLYPQNNTRLEGLYVSGGNYCTQCEAEGFRRITYYPDRPDVMSVFTVRIEADKASYPVLLSNGNRIAQGNLEGGRHFAVWADPFPKPCYLFALVAGDLHRISDTFITRSGRAVDLNIYVRAGDEAQCAHAMASLKKSMTWDEETYGLEYDLNIFNIVAVSDFNMGAMENKSLNIFNTKLVLAHPDTATDADFLAVESVIAHEYFHNWSGNRVTCRDWFQLSLKEGLTVFRDQEFSADLNARAVQRIDDVRQLRQFQFPEDAGPMAHPVRPESYMEINNFYTMTVYEKGAEIIRMMRTLMGPELYRKGTDLYFSRHDGQAVTCDDFAACMAQACGLDLDQFKLWYSQSGTPEITAHGVYDAQAKTYTLDLAQSIPATPGQPHKKPMHIPVAVGLVGPDGADIPLKDGATTQILNLREEKQRFVFTDIPRAPVPSILRNFSAPVRLKTDLDDAALRFLMVHDSDGFNRWEAGQTIALRLIGRMLDGLEQGGEPETDPAFVDSIAALLDQAARPGADLALIARMLALPDFSVIGAERRHIDPAAIHAVRQKIIQDVVSTCRARLMAVYDSARASGPHEITPQAMARRALRNAALAILAFDPESTPLDLIRAQYDNASCMTDRVGALALLAHLDGPQADAAFDDFHARFKNYPLVIDKWFALQTLGVRDDALSRVRALREHADFSIRNPNRVRALYASFAMGNPVCFHDPSGLGYRFLGDAIAELNVLNPQIASRILTPLREWRRYTPDRQDKMRAVLEDIAARPDLSPDVYEIVTKTLQG
ncbi:MAG: aminopeptidase N [Rhodospirillales bacterium]|nr:aminopeptidase N [Rhodospirillales bacterium]